jgi:EamA domain-containing membrane protein RarD
MFFVGITNGEQATSKKKKLTAFAAGIIMGIGWWIFIDSAAYASYINDPLGVPFVFMLPMFTVIIGIFFLNSFNWSNINSPIDPAAGSKAQAILLVSLILCFASIIAQVWFLVEVWGSENSKAISSYVGVGQVVCTMLTFLAGVILRTGDTGGQAI